MAGTGPAFFSRYWNAHALFKPITITKDLSSIPYIYFSHPSFIYLCSSTLFFHPDVGSWLRANQVSQETCDRLHREMIRTMSDLRQMKEQDIVHLGLPVGEHIRLRSALEKLGVKIA